MCGIFGTTDEERFKTLYELNSTRGYFAHGAIQFQRSSEGLETSVWKGADKLTSIPASQSEVTYVAGHTQAPTSANREFQISSTHPIQSGGWLVAHNGVLSNWEEIASKYDLDPSFDTECIAQLLNHYSELPIPDAIQRTCSELEGLFGCWIVKDDQLFVVKSGSTLFMRGAEFSSIKPDEDDWEPVRDGVILQLISPSNPEDFLEVGMFKTKSAFFVI